MAVQNEVTRAPLAEPDPDAFIIEDVETLKALADPLRMRLLLETADVARTAKELAAILDVPQTRLYYHIGILQRRKLLRVARRRKVSGIEERSYQAVAKSWTPAPSVMSALVESGVLGAMLAIAGAELELVLAQDSKIGDPAGAVPALAFTELEMSVADVEELQRRLEAVMQDFGFRKHRPGKARYHALLIAYRKPPSPRREV